MRAAHVLLALSLAACSPSEEQAREQARQALARGDRSGAIHAIEALSDAQRDTPEACIEQADLWVRAGEAPRAVWLLEDAVARFDSRSDLRLALANAALLVGDTARADAIARDIPESAPEHAQALLVRARASIALGDLEAGLAAFREAERARPERAELRIPRIAALLEERRFAEARVALDEARAGFADAASTALLRSLELWLLQYQAQDALRHALEALQASDADAAGVAQRDFEQALVGVRELARGAPDDTSAWQALTGLAIAGSRVDLAEPALRAAIEQQPDRVALHPMLAELAAARGDDAAAEALLRDAVRRDDSAVARVSLARFLAVRDRRDDAIAEVAAGLAQRPDDEPLRFVHAELLLDAARADEAADAVARYQALRPDAQPTALLRARLALLRGDAAGARAQLEALAPELDTAATQYWLARALEASGDRVGAAHRMRLASLRDPAAPGPWLELLRLAQERGDPLEAARAASSVVQRAPRLFVGWQGLVDAWIEQGRPDAALETARRALALQPERWESQLLLARALRANGRQQEALAQLDVTAQRFGGVPEVTAERVLALGLSGRLDAARAEAERAIDAHGDAAVLHHALAGVLFQAGRAEEGAAEVDRALALAPDDLRPLALRCEFYAATSRFEAAVADCARFLERHPDHVRMHFAQGAALAGAGRKAEAEASYRRAAALDPRAIAPRNNLALLLAERGELDAALAAAQEAFAQAGESPEVLDTLGWLYLEKGLVARAVSLLEDAHRRAPQLDAAALHLALAYRAAGREDAARPLLDALGARAASSPELQAQLDAARARR